MDRTVDVGEMQKLANRLVIEAGKLALSLQSTQTTFIQKDIVDTSTTADIACEKLIIKEIKIEFPTHSIYAEESGTQTAESDYMWIVDPIDGTKEYARGSKDFNCLIAVEKASQALLGSIYHIGTNDLYECSLNKGAFLNGSPIQVSTVNQLEKCFIGSNMASAANTSEFIETHLALVKELIHKIYRLRPGWNDALFLGYTASGLLDGHIVLPSRVDWYDIAPGILLVEEAGGKITDFYGNPLTKHDLSKGVIASNKLIHDQLLEIIKNHFDS